MRLRPSAPEASCGSSPDRSISAGVPIAPAGQKITTRLQDQPPGSVSLAIDGLQTDHATFGREQAGRLHPGQDREVLRIGGAQGRLRDVVLGLDAAREPVTGEAVQAARLARAGVVDGDGQLKRLKPDGAGGVEDSLGGGGERRRRERVVSRSRRLRRVDPGAAVNFQQRLRGGVVGLEVGVGDRPAREIGLAQAQGRAAEEDRVAAHHLVGEGLHGRPGAVLLDQNWARAFVALVEKDGAAVPVGLVAVDPTAPLHQQHVEPGARQSIGGGGPAEAGAHDDDVERGALEIGTDGRDAHAAGSPTWPEPAVPSSSS